MTAFPPAPIQQGSYNIDPETMRRMEKMICTLARSVCRAVNAMDRAEFPPRPRQPKPTPDSAPASAQVLPSNITPAPRPQPEPALKPTAAPVAPASDLFRPPISDLRISVQTRCTLLQHMLHFTGQFHLCIRGLIPASTLTELATTLPPELSLATHAEMPSPDPGLHGTTPQPDPEPPPVEVHLHAGPGPAQPTFEDLVTLPEKLPRAPQSIIALEDRVRAANPTTDEQRNLQKEALARIRKQRTWLGY